MKTGGGEGGGGGGGGAAGIGMRPGAPRLVHSGPETPPQPGPPPPPPTWLQRSAQAGPAGGRERAGRAEREVRRGRRGGSQCMGVCECVSVCARARGYGRESEPPGWGGGPRWSLA